MSENTKAYQEKEAARLEMAEAMAKYLKAAEAYNMDEMSIRDEIDTIVDEASEGKVRL